MPAAILSYRKTAVASLLAGLAVISATLVGQLLADAYLPGTLAVLVALLGWMVGALMLLVAAAGMLVLVRHRGRERGDEDLFLRLNRAKSERALLGRARQVRFALRRLGRWLGASTPRVGEVVRIRSLEEISATLDANGCLDGLPFMPEMVKYCGSTGTVFRHVDKIYDYGGRKDLRRMKDAVLIAGLRCDGSAHDGCQARCYLLWKSAWITSVDSPAAATPVKRMALGPTFIRQGSGPDKKYVCQFTELVRASSSMSGCDPRQDLRPLLAGNVTISAFCVAMLTRLFNLAQRLRGGIGFPANQRSSGVLSPRTELNLQPGELVRVCEPQRIFETLDRTGKNRGLWFDRDMLKHTKQRHKVLARIERIIDDASGRMLQMKTPCIVLEGVDASGEVLRFCPQHDLAFWREAWLERIESVEKAV